MEKVALRTGPLDCPVSRSPGASAGAQAQHKRRALALVTRRTLVHGVATRRVRGSRPWRTLPGPYVGVAEEKREQGKPAAVRDACDLVQVGTGKDHRVAGRGTVEMGAVFGKPEGPALVRRIQIQGERKPAVGGGGTEVVAVGVKTPPVAAA